MWKLIRNIATALVLGSGAALGQSVPNPETPITPGSVWTPAQWNNAFRQKVDGNGGDASNVNVTSGGTTQTLAQWLAVSAFNLASPGPIGSTTPGTGAFTTLGAVSVSVAGASPATSGAAILSITNTTQPVASNELAYEINDKGVYAIPTYVSTVRPRIFETDLSVPTGVTSASIHENFWSSNYLTGGGTSAVEINQFHAYFENNMTGSVTGPVEGYEASAVNSGTMTGSGYADYLGLFTNNTSATTSAAFGLKAQLINNNTTSAAVGTYAGVDCEAMGGSGSHPTFEYCIRNGNANGIIASLGPVVIGQIGGSNAMLQIKGTDQSSSTSAMRVLDSTGASIFEMHDDGSMGMVGNMAVGALSGGSTRLFVKGLDQSSGTAAFAVADSTSANLFQVHDDGSLSTKGNITSVSCAAASVSLTTLVVTNGIVTHC